MAKENKQPEQNEALRGILDPIAPEDLTEHWQNISGWLDPMRDLNPEYLANMDYNKPISGGNQSFNQYWDDSSPEKQWTLGWTNQKYTWEYTKNSDINYDANITTKDLNPNFVYGQASKVYGTDHPWYISQRNDQIASALFNEWRVSKEEVQKFLESQKWFFNSSEADRANTIESIWKRLWQMKPAEKPDESKADEIVKDNSWEIYGKTSAEEWNPKEWIQTKSDTNSVFTAMEEARASNLKTLISTPPADIASALDNWLLPWDLQSIRDMQQYYPEIWEEVKQYQKKNKVQNEVNSMTKWEQSDTSNAWQSVINNANTDFANKNASSIKSSQEITADVNNSLASNQSAQEASETMATLEEDIATLKNRLKNLRNEANAAFKWDVPQYLVNAYVANKTQEIQNQMKILEDRYNMAYNRYKDEVANTHWEKEYQLKQDQLELQKQNANLEKWYKEQWIAIEWYKAKWGNATTNPWDSYEVSTMSDEEIADAVDELLDGYDNWKLGNAQCAAWIQKYYLPKLWIELSNLSSWENKKKLINTDSDYVPKKWDLIIINSGAKLANWTPAWHIWIVIWVTGDYVQYLDWNGSVDKDWKWTEKAKINSVKMDNKKIEWYRNVNKKWWWTSVSFNREFTESDYEAFESFLDTDKKTRLSQSEKEAIAEQYWFKDNLKWMTDFANEALKSRPEVPDTETVEPENMTWVDYTWLTDEQIANIEKKIGYNPNIEWELKKIIDKWIPTSWPAMQNVLNTVRAKDEEQLWQWIDHYQNKINAEAVQAWEDILILLAQLQNNFQDADRVDEVTKGWKTKTIFDTNATQWWWWGAIWIKYNQLINQLLLNKVTEAREKWATFWQMTEYEWKILEDAASALKIKFWWWSSDESFSAAFFDLVDATWKLTNWTNKWPTRSEWNSFVNQIRKDSEWYMTQSGADGSNLWWSGWWTSWWAWTWWSNERTKEELFSSN